MDLQQLKSLKICIEKHDKKGLHKKISQGVTLAEKSALQTAFFKSKQWPDKETLSVSFIPEISTKVSWTSLEELKNRGVPLDPLETTDIRNMNQRDAVKKIVLERIQPICNINFEFVDSGGIIRIAFMEGKGAWSEVGTDALDIPDSEPTINFGWLDVATIMHEFGHVLGMIHEHQNQRGKGIEWNKPKVYEWAASTQGWDKTTTYNNILKKYELDQINGSDFDPNSIMLYFFPAELTLNNKGTKQNLTLSDTDVAWIEKEYPNGRLSSSQFLRQVYGRNIYITSNTNIFYIILLIILVVIIIAVITLLVLRHYNLSFRNSTDLISF
jgi:hypothetical protein